VIVDRSKHENAKSKNSKIVKMKNRKAQKNKSEADENGFARSTAIERLFGAGSARTAEP